MLDSAENSEAVQLIETTEAPLRTATTAPFTKSLRLFEGVSTSRIVAFGAMACAHSTSSAISMAQFAFEIGAFPVEYTLRKQPLELLHAARPYCWSNTPRSASAFGSS